MIHVHDGKIIFTPRPNTSIPGLVRMERKLISAHTCPRCFTVVRAVFETPKPISLKGYTQSGPKHTTPRYKVAYIDSLMCAPPGQTLLEVFHYDLDTTNSSSRCPHRDVLLHQSNDPVQLVAVLLRAMQNDAWAPVFPNTADWILRAKVLEYIRTMPDGPEKARRFLLECKAGLVEVPDHVPGGPTMYLANRAVLFRTMLTTYLNNVFKPRDLAKVQKEVQ